MNVADLWRRESVRALQGSYYASYCILLYDWYTEVCNNPNKRVQISCVNAQFETRLNQFFK